MRKFSKKQYLVAGVAAAAVIGLGTGTAIAYWSSSGSGTGSATTATGSTVNITDNSSGLTAMYPGDSPQTVTVTVTNNSTTQKAYVAGVTALLSVTKAGGAPAGTCDASDYLLNGAPGSTTPSALTWTGQELNANGGNATATYSLQFNDKTTAQDTCKGASVAITYASS